MPSLAYMISTRDIAREEAIKAIIASFHDVMCRLFSEAFLFLLSYRLSSFSVVSYLFFPLIAHPNHFIIR